MLTFLGKRDLADVMKDLRWRDCPGLSGWAQCYHKNPYKREVGGSNSVVGDVTADAKGWSDAKQGPQAKECRWLREAGKARKWLSP